MHTQGAEQRRSKPAISSIAQPPSANILSSRAVLMATLSVSSSTSRLDTGQLWANKSQRAFAPGLERCLATVCAKASGLLEFLGFGLGVRAAGPFLQAAAA
mmetsp:Transcript_17010/g.42508  ORF Transcript_17010/g.42508 Transcript_17010/m.42508 type:complete len:101 (-) Transcript_17010:865-1167(-)